MTERFGGAARGLWRQRLLMLVTDRKLCGDRSLAEVVDAAIEGGVNAVQLREKDLPAAELLALARQLRGVCGRRALLLINDRVDVALLCGADGVHLPENGLPVAATRALLPPSMRVGCSVHSVKAARQAELDGVDYVVAGPIFPTTSHPGAIPAGLELVSSLSQRLSIPAIAIGGIQAGNAAECWTSGAAGIAVISAIMRDPDAAAAAARLLPAEAALETEKSSEEESCA